MPYTTTSGKTFETWEEYLAAEYGIVTYQGNVVNIMKNGALYMATPAEVLAGASGLVYSYVSPVTGTPVYNAPVTAAQVVATNPAFGSTSTTPVSLGALGTLPGGATTLIIIGVVLVIFALLASKGGVKMPRLAR